MYPRQVFTQALLYLSLVANSSAHLAVQHPIGEIDQWNRSILDNVQSSLDRLTTPFENLDTVSATTSPLLVHPLFPHYAVRIKESMLCENTQVYSGYIDRGTKHLFFYFFESRNVPEADDVIFWTSGGPGGSSALGLFMEFGPCRLTSADGGTFNPNSWNEYANVFFVDQPVGVGYSYADYAQSVDNSIEAGEDIAAFTAIFFEHFTKFKGLPFHMAGSSYGGRYIPVFAAAVLEQNARLVEAGATPVNLSSIMIGNGCTHYSAMVLTWYDMQCKNISIAPVQDINTCVKLKHIKRCETLMRACDDRFNALDCAAARLACEDPMTTPFYAKGYNPYDLSKLCDGQFKDTLCYPISNNITTYLNREDVRKILGVDDAVERFILLNPDVQGAFWARLDIMFPTHYHIAELLERGVRALIYVGVNDLLCNQVGNERMTLNVEWTGKDTFAAQPLRRWEVDGEIAGYTRSAGPFTYATILGAGHMAPYDKPQELLEMVRRWLAHEEL